MNRRSFGLGNGREPGTVALSDLDESPISTPPADELSRERSGGHAEDPYYGNLVCSNM